MLPLRLPLADPTECPEMPWRARIEAHYSVVCAPQGGPQRWPHWYTHPVGEELPANWGKCLQNVQWDGGLWVAQSVKRLTLGFDSGHDLAVRGFEPCVGLHADSVEPVWDSLSSPLSSLSLLVCVRSLSLSVKINK